MQSTSKRRGFWGGLFVLAFGSITLYCAALAQGPDRELTFTREVVSQFSIDHFEPFIANLSQWPKWHYSLSEAKAMDSSRKELSTQKLQAKMQVRLKLVPPNRPWKKFEVLLSVLEYDPGRFLHLALLEDSSGRLTTLFDRLEWKIKWIPEGSGTLIQGSLLAHTSHWRSRLFGALAQRILLNQLFYPDLIKMGNLPTS